MEFVHPSFLWALFALSIPVLIHLFHFRRYKTVYFPNVKFLREVKQERNNIRLLKRWLLLAARLLALAFLVFAFAQPFLKGKEAPDSGKNAVSVFLDNSPSMGLMHKGVPLLELGRDRVREILESYGPEDTYQVLTADLKPEEQRWSTRQDALNYLERIGLSNSTIPLQQVFDKQDYLFTRSDGDVFRRYIVSDFQESMIAGAALPQDSTRRDYFIQMETDNVRNIFVDSIWIPAPVQLKSSSNSVLYTIRNSSALEAPGVRVTLQINDKMQSIRELNLSAGETRTDTLYFNVYKEGWQLASILLDDYPITIDDQFYFSFEVSGQHNVLEVFDGSTPDVIRRIFEQDDHVVLTRSSSDRLNYSGFPDYSLIVLNELDNISSGLASSLKNYLEGGGNALLIPKANASATAYRELLQLLDAVSIGAVKTGNYKMQRPNLSNVLLKGIVERYPENTIVPEVRKYYPISAGSRSRQKEVLLLNNGDGLLSWFPYASGNLFIQAVPASSDYSDLANNWFYAPVIYNLALHRTLSQELYLTSGVNKWVPIGKPLERREDVVRLTGSDMDFIPEQRIADGRLLINPGRSGEVPAGHYQADINDIAFASVSINLNRSESEMAFPDADRLKEQFPGVSSIVRGTEAGTGGDIRRRDEGRPLWRWCLALAILFVIAEVAIIKWLPE